MVANADKHRRDLRFSVGDAAMLSNEGIQFKEARTKLAPLYSGPFKVLEVISSNAYRLELPPRLTVHVANPSP